MLRPQPFDQLVGLLWRDIAFQLALPQHAWGLFAHAHAFRELHRDLAVGAASTRLDAELFAEMAEQLFPAVQHAGQAAADPDARLAERILFVTEEAVEAHGVVH